MPLLLNCLLIKSRQFFYCQLQARWIQGIRNFGLCKSMLSILHIITCVMLNYRRVKFEKPQIYYEIHYKCRGGNPAKKTKNLLCYTPKCRDKKGDDFMNYRIRSPDKKR